MHTSIDNLFANLWQDYLAITPSARQVHALLGDSEGTQAIVNDHIALRTFNIDKINLEKLAAHFLALGDEEKGQYDFAEKKVVAKQPEHTQHPCPQRLAQRV